MEKVFDASKSRNSLKLNIQLKQQGLVLKMDQSNRYQFAIKDYKIFHVEDGFRFQVPAARNHLFYTHRVNLLTTNGAQNAENKNSPQRVMKEQKSASRA
jgi:hypothetical protein